MNHDAVLALYPNVVSVDDTAGAIDADGNRVNIDLEAINAWVDPNAYKVKRVLEYPDFREYLDGLVKGDQEQIRAYIDACLAVKAKYPKGGQ